MYAARNALLCNSFSQILGASKSSLPGRTRATSKLITVSKHGKAYQGRGEGGRGMEMGEEGNYISIATLSPP